MTAMKPPAGEKIDLSFARDLKRRLVEQMQQDGTVLFASGAMAMSAAIAAVVARRGLDKPKVLLPAYTCPSVPASVRHAGAQPVLVDLRRDSLMVDEDKLRELLDQNTVAVICVNPFGVNQPVAKISAACRLTGTILIEDNAQGWPDLAPSPGNDAAFTILSFGRGKQLSVLGGGAAVVNDPQWRGDLKFEQATSSAGPGRAVLFAAKVCAYNLLRWPPAFGLLESMSFAGIGETRYKDLPKVAELGAERTASLALGLQADEGRRGYPQASIEEFLSTAGLENVEALASDDAEGRPGKMLRYPLLARSQSLRDKLITEIRGFGIGASKMYGAALPAVADVPGEVASQGPFPNAQSLAGRLLTLPLHSAIDDADLSDMFRVLRAAG